MQVRVDKRSRLVLPKIIRRQLGISAGTALELIPGPDGVLLRKVADTPSMRLVDGFWVHQGDAQSSTDWNGVIDSVRDQRAAMSLALVASYEPTP